MRAGTRRGGTIRRRAGSLLALATLVAGAIVAAPGGTGATAGRAAVAEITAAASTDPTASTSAAIHLPPHALRKDTPITIAPPDTPELAMFPDLPVLRVTPPQRLDGVALIRIPYTDEFLHRYNVVSPRALVLYELIDDGLWAIVPSSLLPDEHMVVASVDRLTTWAVAPAGLLSAWQEHDIIGQTLAPDARNVLVLHGWNSSPWDGCTYELIGALSSDYDRVAAYVYPSVLDIASNARWLREFIQQRYPGVTFDVVAFSEGGLVARAAIEPDAWNGGDTMPGVRNLITIATPHEGLLPDALPSLLGDVAAAQMHAGSTFLRALNAGPHQGAARYLLIAGSGGAGGSSDGLVPLDSALARGALDPAGTATLPLVHARFYGASAAMPCDPRVYAQIAAWAR